MRYFWENDVIYSNFQPRIGTRKINGGVKFSEIKVQKNARCNVRNRLKFGKLSRKTYCVRKCKKNGYQEFDHRGTLRAYVIRLVYFSIWHTLSSFDFVRLPERGSVTNSSHTTLDSETALVLKNENETETGEDLLAERNNDATSSPIASSSASKN